MSIYGDQEVPAFKQLTQEVERLRGVLQLIVSHRNDYDDYQTAVEIAEHGLEPWKKENK